MKKILIICTGNSCRSQMAEGWLRHFGKRQVEVSSAGTRPSVVNPLAIQVMSEAGVDISSHRSKSTDEFIGRTFDYVVTVCDNAREECPVFPGKHKTLHMPFDDPSAFDGPMDQKLEQFRKTRDLIAEGMKELATIVVPAT